jgi:hypothetical protein
MKKIIAIVLVTAGLFTSCKKNKDNNNGTCTTAKVEYGGDPAADGLGWILVTDTTTHAFEAPENLAAEFKVPGKLVDVCYYKTANDFSCFCVPPLQKMVYITSIKTH